MWQKYTSMSCKKAYFLKAVHALLLSTKVPKVNNLNSNTLLRKEIRIEWISERKKKQF